METQNSEIPTHPGQIVQLDPEKTTNHLFAGCLMTIETTHAWGVQGYVTVPGKGHAYYRAEWGTFEPTGGTTVWVVDNG